MRWGVILAVLGLVWFAVEARAQPELSADLPISFDGETGELVARGEATFTDRGVRIVADEIIFNRRTEVAVATGNVRVTRENVRLVASKLTLRLQERTFDAEDFRMGVPPLFGYGARVRGTFEEVVVEEAVFTYGEPAWLTPQVAVDTATLEPGESLAFKRAVLRIGRQPIFLLPDVRRDISGRTPFEIEGDLGYSGNLGAYFQSRILLPIAGNVRAGVLFDGYTKRGFAYGPALGYRRSGPDGTFMFDGYAGFIDDGGELGEDLLDRPVQGDRHFGEARLLAWNRDAELLGRLAWWSDSEVTRDFRPGIYDESAEPDNFVEGLWRRGNWIADAIVRFAPNDFHANVQRLPELRLHYLPTRVGVTPLVHRFQTSAAHLVLRDPEIAWVESDRLDTAYELAWPIEVAEGVQFRPVAGTRVTYYDDATDGGSYTRVLGEIGFDASLVAHGTWELRNEIWGINGIRHLIRPVVQYRFTPSADAGEPVIPTLDGAVFATHRKTLSLFDTRAIDDLGERHVLRVGLENRVQTRSGAYGSRDLATFFLYQDVDFTPPGDEETFSRLNLDTRLHPAPWLELAASARANPEDGKFVAWRGWVAVESGNVWRLSLGTYQLDDRIEEYGMNGRYRFSPELAFLFRASYDGRESRLNEHAYGIVQRISRVWELTYEIAFRSGAERESDFSFRIRADLIEL